MTLAGYLAIVPVMVDSTYLSLKRIQIPVASWFRDHAKVFTDDNLLGAKEIVVTSEEKDDFLQNIYRPYIQSVIDHINSRLESSDLISSISVFDPRHIPDTEEELSSYGDWKITTLLKFYCSPQKVHFEGEDGTSQPDIEIEEAESEWKLFRRVIFVQYKNIKNIMSCQD